MTTHSKDTPHRYGLPVLACAEETCEDQCTNPAEYTDQPNNVIRANSEQCDIVNLYSADEEASQRACLPFLQNISFAGPKGEIVRARALFDEGAMVSVMCSSVFNRVKHWLGNWIPSARRLRMANGTIIPSQAIWKGTVTIGGVQAEGEFEVFDSGGGWKFLLGKPMLQVFQAIHDYSTDQVQVMGEGRTKTLYNQSQAKAASVEDVREEGEQVGITMKEQDTREEIVPPKEVSSSDYNKTEKRTDQTPTAERTIPVQVYTDDGAVPQESLKAMLDTIPANFLQDDKAIFTRVTDPRNPRRIAYVVKSVQYGGTLTEDERKQAEALVARYADIFACSLTEVIQVPGAQHRLNIPDNATFNLRVHQRALTPPQTQFLHGRIDEMLEAGIIEWAPPDAVKCCATTVLAQKTHEQKGLTLDELRHRINEQCEQEGRPPAFELPEREVLNKPREERPVAPQKWRICQNFNEVNRHTVIAPMLQGDI
ncbi:hypothetical protein F4604DRAFT_1939409 [Suillus subluteus]|nr:hypothetical protein F4604DRAFT_1939409 [Suillus subluteus]